jgi:hypothetical protein
MSRQWRNLAIFFAGFCFPSPVFAQWTQQTISLQPGWNAVFFEVDPQPRDCDTIFQGIPVESVWGWNRRFTSVQFVQDPNTLLPEDSEWLAYFPASSLHAVVTNLWIIQGGRAYLVKLGGTRAVNLVVTGRPRIRPIQWLSDSFNFVGGRVDGASPPTFADFFASSPSHAGQEILRLGSDGKWHKVGSPASDRMRRGEAFWVYCKGQSQYQGPLSVAFDVGDGLDYARILAEQTLRIQNASASPRTITVRQRTSGAVPADPSLPVLAGAVPLSRYEFDVAAKRIGWYPISGPLALTIPARGELAVRLAVRRPDMAAFTPPLGREALYQSLLDVSDAAGSLLVLPVSAQGLNAPRVSPGVRMAAGRSSGGMARLDVAPHPRTGLWVGNATINAVSNPTSGSLNPDQPTTVAAPATFRVIVHVDSSGQARLLQQVLQMWKPGAWIPNPDDSTSATFILDPNNSGRTVLLTDDSLIPQFGGVALRDTKLVGRRISSAVFGFPQPIAMGGGGFGVAGGNPVTCIVVLDYRDRLNPFVHQYHPDHDNLDARYETTLPAGKESYTVTREIALGFTAADPEGLISADWGDEELGGIYSEKITGFHRRAIHIRGIFRLQRLSDVGVLNDGLR